MCAIDPEFAEYFEEKPQVNFEEFANIDILSNDIPSEDVKIVFNIDESSILDDVEIDFDELNKKRKKETQASIDRKLIEEFYANPTNEKFKEVWIRFYYGVTNYAWKYVRDWDTAKDIAVQTFERAWEYRDKYDITKSVYSTWLYTICRNLCLGHLYRKAKDNYINQDISNMYDSALLQNCISNSGESSQYLVNNGSIEMKTFDEIQQELYDTSVREIDNLSSKCSTILRLKLIDNMKIREIADKLNMNESTVKDYLYKGKGELQKLIKTKYKSLYKMYKESADDESDKIF